jgi:hypothetical protein
MRNLSEAGRISGDETSTHIGASPPEWRPTRHRLPVGISSLPIFSTTRPTCLRLNLPG